MLLRILRMSRKYTPQIVAATLCTLAAAILNIVTPEIVRRLTAFLTDVVAAGAVTAEEAAKTIVTLAVVLVAAYAARAVMRFTVMYTAHIAAWNFVGELTHTVYEKLQRLSMHYYYNKQTGQLMSRVINDTRMLEVLIAHALPDLFSNVVVVVTVAVAIFCINPTLALLALIPVPLVLASGVVFSKKVSPLFKINQRVLGELSGALQDDISGVKEIQAFCAEDIIGGKMKAECRHYSNVNIHANFVNAIFTPSVEFLCSLGTVAVVGLGGLLAVGGSLSVADIVGFFMYLGLFYSPLATLARIFEDVQSALAGAERVFEVLDADDNIKDEPDAVDIGKADGEVVFDDVTFSYNGDGSTPVLDHVSFSAKKGEMIAIVGPTGVGKTTTVSLLERFYDVNGGSIRLDGRDIRTITTSSLRRNIALVLQDVFLFNGTIAENIAFGKPGATRAEIEAAAKVARADEFIRETDDGYDTVVGERGMRLSGGQKQRIAIARAVLCDAPVLVLDEATSSVDNETEADIATAINSLAGSRTIIVIAHRLSTVRRADRIIVLKDGRVAEQGSHDELVAAGGEYAKMLSI